MRTDFAIGRLFGVQIALHISWFAIAFLLSFSLSQRFQSSTPTGAARLCG
jgi:hypothetical protein